MTVFEKNMTVLSGRYPDLAKLVKSTAVTNYQVVPSFVKLMPNLLCKTDRDEILFYDPADPLAHIRSVLTDLKLESALVIVLLGLGLGYNLKILFSALRNKGPLGKIIVVEKDLECLRLALEIQDLSEILANPQVKLIIGCSEEDLYVNIWNAISPEFGILKAIKFIPWPASIRLAYNYYHMAKVALKDVARSFIAERGNDPYDTLVAYENFFVNLPQYLSNPGVHCIKDLFPGRPAVVVAAGPSLNKNAHLLRMLDQRAVILSADASLKPLSQWGVMPHLITTVERTPGSEKFFENVSPLEHTVLAVVSFTYPRTLDSYPGPLLFMHRKYHFYETLGIDQDCFEMGGTTAHCAFAIAASMGCNPIIFIGQDLSFGPDGVTHARGCAFGQRQAYAAEAEKIEVPANMGGTVMTCSLWLRLLREYERTLSDFTGLAINATEGGARIHGTQVMSFREAIEGYCQEEFNPRDTLLKHLEKKQATATPSSIRGRMDWLVLETQKVLQASRSVLEVVSPVLRKVEESGDDLPGELKIKILRTSDILNKLADHIMTAPLFSAAGEYFMSVWVPLLIEWQVVTERFSDRVWAEAYRLQLGEEGFGAIGQLCVSLLDVLEKGKKQVEALLG